MDSKSSIKGANHGCGLLTPDSGFSSAVPSIIDYAFQVPPQTTPEPMSPASCQMDTSPSPSYSAEMALKAIPTLIDLLADEDIVVQTKASNMVLQLSQDKGSRDTISNSPQMMIALLETLSKTSDMDIIENGVGVLNNLSEYRLGRQTIYKLNGIPELIRMLDLPSESIVHLAITALHLLLLHQDGSKEAVRSGQGLSVMFKLLFNPNEQFLSIVIDCIRLLAYGDSETKLVIHSLGITERLVQILDQCSYPNLIFVTCGVLKNLSVCPVNKRTIIDCGGLQALAMHLNPAMDIDVSNCLFVIRNLSDAAVNQEGLDMLLPKVIDILRTTLCTQDPTSNQSINIITWLAGILSNLTCAQVNKQIVRRMGGVELLIQCIMLYQANDSITEPSVCALRHLTCRYPEYELAAYEIRDRQGLVPIINLLNSRSWDLKKAVIGLIRNLALCNANIVPLREHYAIQKLSCVLQEATISAGSNDIGGGTTIIDPTIEAIIESARATLTIMAKDPLNKEMIEDALSIPPTSTDLAFVGFGY